MARKPRRPRQAKTAVAEYRDEEGSTLVLRESLSSGTIAKIKAGASGQAVTADDDWRRRQELLFERLAVRWDIAGLPLTDQSMLLGRYRMADEGTQRWVRETMRSHVERHLPELAEG